MRTPEMEFHWENSHRSFFGFFNEHRENCSRMLQTYYPFSPAKIAAPQLVSKNGTQQQLQNSLPQLRKQQKRSGAL